MHRNIWIAAVSLLSIGGVACSDSAEPEKPKEATYWQDVAPLLFDNCVTCHQSGGIAPFRLDSYAEARSWSVAIKQAVEGRTMPPWLVTSDGSCGEFHNPRWLENEEIATIAAWVEAGTPEGTPRDDLQVPMASEPGKGLEDGKSQIMAFATPNYVPEPDGSAYAKFDDYRCFLLDGSVDSKGGNRFITGYEVIPGNAAMVHHMLLMVVDPNGASDIPGKTNMDLMRAMDEASPDRLGWPCFSQAGDGVTIESLPATWAPGMGPVPYPDTTGLRVPAGRVLVAQMHYNLVDERVRGQPDSTRVRLRVADSVQREGFFMLPDEFLGSSDSLAPGKESVKYTWETDFDREMAALGVDHVDVYGVFPHMHELGQRYRLEFLDTADGVQCGAEVKHWDFDWQLFYFYERPYQLRQGTRVRVTCDYDTRGRTEPTLPGWGTQNEMCVGGMYVVLP
ncbi:monooxygenase [Hyalangium versicolor]|uniref:monooxygenase n=1 Tax=Hyalangium versicolor TaxID=2861190 RepID=UPI001CC9DEB5|nr:hypothetical protein [Hyalangium versicolor]